MTPRPSLQDLAKWGCALLLITTVYALYHYHALKSSSTLFMLLFHTDPRDWFYAVAQGHHQGIFVNDLNLNSKQYGGPFLSLMRGLASIFGIETLEGWARLYTGVSLFLKCTLVSALAVIFYRARLPFVVFLALSAFFVGAHNQLTLSVSLEAGEVTPHTLSRLLVYPYLLASVFFPSLLTTLSGLSIAGILFFIHPSFSVCLLAVGSMILLTQEWGGSPLKKVLGLLGITLGFLFIDWFFVMNYVLGNIDGGERWGFMFNYGIPHLSIQSQVTRVLFFLLMLGLGKLSKDQIKVSRPHLVTFVLATGFAIFLPYLVLLLGLLHQGLAGLLFSALNNKIQQVGDFLLLTGLLYTLYTTLLSTPLPKRFGWMAVNSFFVSCCVLTQIPKFYPQYKAMPDRVLDATTLPKKRLSLIRDLPPQETRILYPQLNDDTLSQSLSLLFLKDLYLGIEEALTAERLGNKARKRARRRLSAIRELYTSPNEQAYQAVWKELDPGIKNLLIYWKSETPPQWSQWVRVAPLPNSGHTLYLASREAKNSF